MGKILRRVLGLIRVSVVIPAYNAAWSIADTIRSVQCQSLKDIEIIVVNDGSRDGTADVAGQFAAQDPRIRILSQDNGGLAAARNAGAHHAGAAYVAFLDSDDVWHPEFLATLAGQLDQHPPTPFAYAYSHRIDTQNRRIAAPEWTYLPRHDFYGLLAINSVGNGSATMFRRTAFDRVGGYDATLRARGAQGAEDWKLCLQLAAENPPVLVPRYLVGYRVTEGSMSQGNPTAQLRAVRTVIADIRLQFPDTPAWCFANARTVLNGWLIPGFLRQAQYATVLRLLFESYALNPLWFTMRELRTIHAMKFFSLWQGRRQRLPLSDLVEQGVRPFAFLVPA